MKYEIHGSKILVRCEKKTQKVISNLWSSFGQFKSRPDIIFEEKPIYEKNNFDYLSSNVKIKGKDLCFKYFSEGE